MSGGTRSSSDPYDGVEPLAEKLADAMGIKRDEQLVISAALALTLTFALAVASYRWFEKPFLKLKIRFQHVRSMPV